MNNKLLVLTAQVISLLFSPFYLPVIAFIVLFLFSYLNLYPPLYKLIIIAMVYVFTVALPRLGIYLYRRLNGWTRHQLGRRERRFVPYILSIMCYAALLYLMYSLPMPRFTLGVVTGALTIQIACAIANHWIKVCAHSAASGGVIGALLAFSLIFNFDPTGWLCLTIVLAGAVGTARLILRQHTLGELAWGTGLGIVCGFFSVLLT